MESFLSNLRKFVSHKGTKLHSQHLDEKPLNSLIESPDEYPAIVNETLYATLVQHSTCTCPSGNEACASQEHWARLRLGAKTSMAQNHVVFDMFVSAAPTSQCIHETAWQHLRFQIPKYGLYPGRINRSS